MIRLEAIHFAAITTGSYDVFVWVAVPSLETLGTLLRETVGSVLGVRSVCFVWKRQSKGGALGMSSYPLTSTSV